MDGTTFEDLVAVALLELGFDGVERTEYYDRGGDLIAVRDGRRVAIQVKRWDGYVDQTAVTQAALGAAAYDCDDAMVITNSFFQAEARKLAEIGGVTLWDQDDLANLLHTTGIAPRTRATPPLCPACSVPMRYRRKHGTFWGCANFPACRVTVMYHRWVLRVVSPLEVPAAPLLSVVPPPPPPPPPPAVIPESVTADPPPPPATWSVIPHPPPSAADFAPAIPAPARRPATAPFLLGFAWLLVLGLAVAFGSTPTTSPNQLGVNATWVALLAVPAIWGTLRLLRARRRSRVVTTPDLADLVGLPSFSRERPRKPANTFIDVGEVGGTGEAEA
jgi:hypothetical protein